MTTAEMHRCRRAARCARRELDETTGKAAGALLDRPGDGLCWRDRTLLARALEEFPELWLLLRQQVRPSLAAAGEDGRGSRTPPLPLRAGPLDLADLVRTELVLWATLVRAATNMRAAAHPAIPAGVHPADVAAHLAARAVGEAAGLLRRATDILLGLPVRQLRRWDTSGTYRGRDELDGVDGAVLLLDLHQSARATAGQTKLVHDVVGPCPRCSAWELQRENGQEDTSCASCGMVIEPERQRFFARVMLEDFRQAAACPRCDHLGRRLDDLGGPLCDHGCWPMVYPEPVPADAAAR